MSSRFAQGTGSPWQFHLSPFRPAVPQQRYTWYADTRTKINHCDFVADGIGVASHRHSLPSFPPQKKLLIRKSELFIRISDVPSFRVSSSPLLGGLHCHLVNVLDRLGHALAHVEAAPVPKLDGLVHPGGGPRGDRCAEQSLLGGNVDLRIGRVCARRNAKSGAGRKRGAIESGGLLDLHETKVNSFNKNTYIKARGESRQGSRGNPGVFRISTPETRAHHERSQRSARVHRTSTTEKKVSVALIAGLWGPERNSHVRLRSCQRFHPANSAADACGELTAALQLMLPAATHGPEVPAAPTAFVGFATLHEAAPNNVD